MGSNPKRRIRRAIQLLLWGMGLALSGCGQDQPSGNHREYDLQRYIQASCELKPGDGGVAVAVQSDSPITVGYFDKRYNRDWLASVAKASIPETERFIRSTGARIYRTRAITEKSCRNFSDLDEAPADLAREFQDKQDRLDDVNEVYGTGSFMTGLYIPKDPRHSLASVRRSSLIVLREDASRWVLIHEFMHHNFKSLAIADGYDDFDAQSARLKAAEKYAEILRNPALQEPVRTQQLVPLFKDLVDAFDAILVQYPLEEMAVEATLQDWVDSGDLDHVPKGSYDNATDYIRKSKGIVASAFRTLDDLFASLRKRTLANHQDALYRSLSFYAELKEKRMQQVADMMAKRSKAKDSVGASASPAADLLPEPGDGGTPAAPCATLAEGMRRIRELSDRLKALR